MHLRRALAPCSMVLLVTYVAAAQGPAPSSSGRLPPATPPPPPSATEPAPPPPPPPPAESAAPAVAPAAPPTTSDESVVVAKDGATFRGVIVERIPGQYVTVRLATGEYRRVAWNFIARVDGPGAELFAGPKVSVRFQADDERAALQKYLGSGNWARICLTPCSGQVSADATYRVGGEGLISSEPFRLRPPPKATRVEAEVHTRARRVGGAILGVGGGGLALMGLSFYAVGAAGSYDNNNGQTQTLTPDEQRGFKTAGGVMMALGVAAGVAGLVLLLNSSSEAHVSKTRSALKLGKNLRLGPAGLQF
jgi:hypothetical protein